MGNFVTIRTFENSADLDIVKSYLESFGIQCFIKDEFANRTYIPSAVGGIKLQVQQSDLEKAVEHLLDGGFLTQEDLEPSTAIKWIDKLLNKFRKKS